ncbi:hypothetical protein D9M68_983420 [compost metagenome]
MAENLEKSGGRGDVADDIASERQALAALGFATQLRIGGLGAPHFAIPHDVAQLAFPYCVADTDDHVRILLNKTQIGIVRRTRNRKVASGSHSEKRHFLARPPLPTN